MRPIQAALHLDTAAAVAGCLVDEAAGLFHRELLCLALLATHPIELHCDVRVEALVEGLPELKLQLTANLQPVLASEIAEDMGGPDAVNPGHMGPVLRLELRADVHDQVPVIEQVCFRIPAALPSSHALHALNVLHQLVAIARDLKLSEFVVEVAADLLSRNQRRRALFYPLKDRILAVDPP